MWLYTTEGFLSVVEDLDRPACLLVRSRWRDHLERLFPGRAETIRHTPDADYGYRVSVERDEVATAVASEVAAIDYPNFKSQAALVNAGADGYLDALHDSHQVTKLAELRCRLNAPLGDAPPPG